MFTGIIEEIGILQSSTRIGDKKLLKISCRKINSTLKTGDSVCCNGACLTLTSFDDNSITLEVMAETLEKTTVKFWQKGDKINLERALLANARLDGHFVQGHVDTVSRCLQREIQKDTLYLWFELPRQFQNMLTWQGSIAINGVSLTVARLEPARFAVALISHTLKETNLNSIKELVNLEFDIIGKYILRYLQNQTKPEITEDWLREKGF